MRWVIMLFGDEFDFDERAEVGRGDGCVVKTELSYVPADMGKVMLKPGEQCFKHVLPIRRKEGRDFVDNHMELYAPPEARIKSLPDDTRGG